MPRRSYETSIYPFSRRLETKRQRKRAEFLESIGVRFEGDPDSNDLPHIYLPRLHRQKTEKDQNTKLGDALLKLAQDSSTNDHVTSHQDQMSTVQREIREFTDWIVLHLRKSGFDLDFKRPIVIESIPPWTTAEKEIPCLLPFSLKKVRLKPLEPGYVVMQLPRRDSTDSDEFSNLRSEDRLHLSPKKTYHLFHKILKKAFQKESIPFERLRMVLKDSRYCIYYDLKNYGWRIEIIPAIHIYKSNAVLVSKPFDIDENASSEMRWRICWAQKEAEIIRSISCTDKGIRTKALQIVCKLCQKDWRLKMLTPYQIQTTLLFDMDYHVDHSPRWQRSSLEECVLSLLNRLLHYAKAGYLPHFIIEGLDLFGLLDPKTVILYKSALERLTTNEKALISLIERTRPEDDAEPLWLEPKPDSVALPNLQIPTYTGIV